MPRSYTSPDRLFDRTWRAGHPFHPRTSRTRRLTMIGLLLVLCTAIGGYWFFTDSQRVRAMAQESLSRLLGGRVIVGGATLSIFQGLRLDDVRVYVDESRDEDSLLFTAQALLVRADPKALLDGRLEPTQIVAIEPHVRLTEYLSSGNWNHQRLRRRPTTRPGENPSMQLPPQLPEVVLRNAVVEYGQADASGTRRVIGTMAIEGQLMPGLERDVYLFKLQSRGATQGLGPSVDGRVDTSSGRITASLMNFRYGPDLEAMFPEQVRRWCQDHGLAGRVDVPELTYQRLSGPTEPGAAPRSAFRAEIDPRDVRLVVRPDEFIGVEEQLRNRWARQALGSLRAAGLDAAGFVDELQAAVEPTPIKMEKVTGKFIFTDDAIEIANISGYVESNGIRVSGRIRDYANPAAAVASIRVSSLDQEDIVVPASPRYINSMPQAVREIYDHLRPQGKCRFWVQVDRPTPDARPTVDGEVQILDGTFVFDEFPYPVHGATGKLVFGRNPTTGAEQLEIVEIRGRGAPGGPNENARVKLVGRVSPFGADTGVNIVVSGEDVVSEPALLAAFPTETQEALKLFDAPGKGQYPTFRGGFTCTVARRPVVRSDWDIVTEIRLQDAAGMLEAFPYPMSGVSGELTVTEDQVSIAHATMKRNGGTLQIDGTVSWKRESRGREGGFDAPGADDLADDDEPHPDAAAPDDEPPPPLRPQLRIVARDVPVDDDLLSALPEAQREWIRKLGLAGRFDLDGEVIPAESRASDVGFDFRIAFRDGTMRPPGAGTFAATGIGGSMRLTPGQLVFEDLSGRRGDSSLSAHGQVDWSSGQTKVVLSADAKELTLDRPLYESLPQGARDAWDQVRPEGTLDASFTYGQESAEGSFRLVLVPRKLAATPKAVPYRLEQVAGTVSVRSDGVELTDVTARHGNAKVKLSAKGSLGAASAWDFRLSAEDVPVDDAFRRALPEALSEVVSSLKVSGKLAFEFDKLLVSTAAPEPRPATGATSAPATAPADPDVDVDFSVALKMDGAAMDVGVPLEEVTGRARFSGGTRAGNLAQMDGAVDIASAKLAGRPATDLRATLTKPAGKDLLRIQKLETRIADGSMAGQFDCALVDGSPTRYALALVLRDADVKALTGEVAPDLRGRLSASLALEGAFNDASSRRGRGDVSVTGQSMYKIPLILGLLQITNLALPITRPFNEAAVRYSVDGQRVTFENIELRARDMLMHGNGHLDFGSKQVRLSFVTDSTSWPKLPIIGDLLQGARHELLQINVRGTLEEPKVSAGAFRTVTTTVDEVFHGADSGGMGRRK
jgi:hypothetical protein